MRALLIVDVQNDFLPEGTLPAPDGDQIIAPINELMEKFDLIIGSKDWHPEDTPHFDKWPKHCVQNTKGAEYHPDLNTDKIDKVFLKGTGETDGYSAFDSTNVDLEDFLKDNNVEELYVCGLTTEYCVKNSSIDASQKGFKTFVVEDAIEAVKANPEDPEKAVKEMKEAGCKIIKRADINSQKVPS